MPFRGGFPRPPVELPAVIEADRPDGRHVPKPKPRPLPEIEVLSRDVSRKPDASHVEECCEDEAVLEGYAELDVPVDHVIPANHGTVSRMGADLLLRISPDSGSPSQEEPLLDRDGDRVPVRIGVPPASRDDECRPPEQREVPAALPGDLVVADVRAKERRSQFRGQGVERALSGIE